MAKDGSLFSLFDNAIKNISLWKMILNLISPIMVMLLVYMVRSFMCFMCLVYMLIYWSISQLTHIAKIVEVSPDRFSINYLKDRLIIVDGHLDPKD